MPDLPLPPDGLLYILFQWVVFTAAVVGIGVCAWTLIVDPLRSLRSPRGRKPHKTQSQRGRRIPR